MRDEIVRKIFHFGALLYVAGFIYVPRKIYLLLLCVLFISTWLVEWSRLHSAGENHWTVRWFGALFREKERNKYSGFFWMLAGVLVTALLIEPQALAVTILLYLIIGDTMAALVGKKIGGPTWPGRQKTWVGSLAFLVSCLVIGGFFLTPPYDSGTGLFWGALTATLAEVGFIPIDDNFIIPVACSVVLMLCYGLTPLLLTFL